MPDIAELGFSVDTGGIDKGIRKMDDLDRAGMKAGTTGSKSGGLIKRSMDGAVLSMDRARKSGQGLTSGFSGLSKIVGGIGLLALGKNSITMAADFSGSMNTVQSKLLISNDAMVMLRDQAKDLGATTVFTAGEAADAMGFLAQAGLDADEIYSAMPATLNLASAAGLDLANAADIATNIVGAFGGGVDSLTTTMDALFIASAKSNTSVEELAEGMKYAGPIANLFGLSANQTAAAMGVLADNGIKGSLAGNTLKNALARLADPSDKALAAMDKLGLSVEDFTYQQENGKIGVRDFADIMKTLGGTTADGADLMRIFGRQAGPGMAALLTAGGGAITELEHKLVSAGTAADGANIMLQGLPGALKLLRSAYDGLVLKLFEDKGGSATVEIIVNKITAGLTWLTTDGIHYIDSFTSTFTDGFKMVSTYVGGFSDEIKTALNFIKPFLPEMDKFGGYIAAAVIALTGLNAVVGVFKIIAGAVGLLNPVTLTIAAIAGGALLIKNNWDVIGPYWNALWNGITSTGKAFLKWWDTFKASFAFALDVEWPSLEDLKKYGQDLINGTVAWWDSLVAFVVNIDFPSWEDIKAKADALLGSLRSWWNGIEVFKFDFEFPDLNPFNNKQKEVEEAVDKMVDTVGEMPVEMAREIAAGKLLVGQSMDDLVKVAAAGGYGKIMTREAAILGNYVAAGVADGMTKGITLVESAATETTDAIKTTIKGGMGIQSPAKVTLEYGKFILEGLAGGILKNLGLATDASEKVVEGVKTAFDDIKNGINEQLIELTKGEDALRKYRLEQKGLSDDAVAFVLAAEAEVAVLQKKKDETERNRQAMEDATNAQKIANAELQGGAVAARAQALELQKLDPATAKHIANMEEATRKQIAFKDGIIDSISSASSIKDIFENLGNYLKDWLKKQIAHFAANKIIPAIGNIAGGDGFIGKVGGFLQSAIGGGGGGGGPTGDAGAAGGGLFSKALGLVGGGGGASGDSLGALGGLLGKGAAAGGPWGAIAAGGAALAGKALSNFKDFDAKGKLAAAALTVLVPGLGAMAAAIGGEKLFGGKKKQTASGFEVGFTGGDVTGNNVAEFEKRRSLFRGTKRSEKLTELDGGIEESVGQYFAQLNTSVIANASALGITGADSILDSFEVATQRFTGENAEAELQEWLSESTRSAYQLAYDKLGPELQGYVQDSVDMVNGPVEDIEVMFARLAAIAEQAVPQLQSAGLILGGTMDSAVVNTMELVDAMGGGEAGMAELNKLLGLFANDTDTANQALAGVTDSVLNLTNGVSSATPGFTGLFEALDRNDSILTQYGSTLDTTTKSGQVASDQIKAFTNGVDESTGKVNVNLAAMLVHSRAIDTNTQAGKDAKAALRELTGSLGFNLDSVIANKDALKEEILAVDATTAAGKARIAELTAELDSVLALEAETARLQANLDAVTFASDTLNFAFDKTSPMAVAAADNLIALSGGLDAFSQGMDKFYQNFYSESERNQIAIENSANSMGELNAQLEAAGLPIVTTKDGFRDMMETLDGANPVHQEIIATALDAQDAIIHLSNAQDAQAQSVKDATLAHEQAVRGTEAANQAVADAYANVRLQALDVGNQFVEFGNNATVLGLNIGGASPSAIAAGQAIVELSGGMDAFSSATQSYYQNFYSESERSQIELAKQAQAVQAFNEQLTAAGLPIATTKEGFREIMESMNPLDAAHQQLIASALGVQGAFIAVADSGKTTDQLISELPESLNGSLSLMGEDTATTAANMVEDSIAANDEQLQNALVHQQEMMALEKQALELKYKEIEAFEQLTQTILEISNAAKVAAQEAAAAEEARINEARLQGSIAAADDILLAFRHGTDQQLTDAIAAADGQVDIVRGREGNITALIDSSTGEILARVNTTTGEMVTLYRDANGNIINSTGGATGALNGFGDSITTLAGRAQAAAQTAMASANSLSQAVAAGNASAAEITRLNQQAQNDHSIAYNARLDAETGTTQEERTQAHINNTEWWNPDGSHSAGLRRVPFNNYRANLHKNERVLTADETRNYERNMVNDRGTMSGEGMMMDSPVLKRIEKELKMLREDTQKQTTGNNKGLQSIAGASNRNARAIDDLKEERERDVRRKAANI